MSIGKNVARGITLLAKGDTTLMAVEGGYVRRKVPQAGVEVTTELGMSFIPLRLLRQVGLGRIRPTPI